MRLNKYLQQAGVGSRREAERLVELGQVQVNGMVAKVTTEVGEADVVLLNGKPIGPSTSSQPRLWRYHKPVGVIVTAKDSQGRQTLYDALAQVPNFKQLPRLMPVGRLDLTSEGLLLLTDSGPLAQILMSPQTALVRSYRVRVHGALTPAQIQQWQRGVTIDDIEYRGGGVTHESASESGQNNWYTITLTEGKNREIRRIFEYFGCEVGKLIRTSYGPLHLGPLKTRCLEEVPAGEVAQLLQQVKMP